MMFTRTLPMRQICWHIQPTFQHITFQTQVALVLSRLDYCNSVLVGLPAYLVRRLQLVLNASAQMICQLRRSDHITDAPCASRSASSLRSLCWRINFFKGLHCVTWVCLSVCLIYLFSGSALSPLCQH